MSDKESLIKDLNGEYENLFGLLMTLGDQDKTEVMLGTWSIREIVVHVGAWLREMTGALERMALHDRVCFGHERVLSGGCAIPLSPGKAYHQLEFSLPSYPISLLLCRGDPA